MPGSKKKSKTTQKKAKDKGFAERTLEGLTQRMEKGEALSDLEVPLYVMLLHAVASRELLNYEDLFEAVKTRVTKIEAHLRTQMNLRQAVEGSRRVPAQNTGPPNQNPFQ